MKTPRPQNRREWRRMNFALRSGVAKSLGVLACFVFSAALANAQIDGVTEPVGDQGQASASAAQPKTHPNGNLDAKMNQIGTVMLRGASLADWMFAIQQEWNINIVFSPTDLEGDKVDGAFEKVTLREILNAILLTGGYGYQRIGNLYGDRFRRRSAEDHPGMERCPGLGGGGHDAGQ